jgi:hypothetical protein
VSINNFGIGYAALASWVPFVWFLNALGREPSSILEYLLFVILVGLGLLAFFAVDNLQVELKNTKRDLAHCREYANSLEAVNGEEAEDWVE